MPSEFVPFLVYIFLSIILFTMLFTISEFAETTYEDSKMTNKNITV